MNPDSVQIEENPYYKPIFVGSKKKFPMVGTYSQKTYFINHLGIKIITDSDELAENLLISKNNELATHKDKKPITLMYLTSESLKILKDYKKVLLPMGPGSPGEIYADSTLQYFTFIGKVKYGTLISIIYGLRAFMDIDKQYLGLHSAAIYDKLLHRVHLLVGKNKVGKSTLAQMIENYDNRFVVISDDWSEINLVNNWVRPMSPLFSPENPDIKYNFQFTSFGKPFYTKVGIDNETEGGKLGKIIEIVSNKNELLSNDFFQRAMFHIPFIAQKLADNDFEININKELISKTISSKVDRIKKAYLLTAKEYRPIRILNARNTTTLNEIMGLIHKAITKS